MPRMDGLSLLAKLQESEEKISAIIVSAYGDMSNIRTAMNRGAFDFVTKPIDFVDLETTIAKTMRHIELLREARERQAEAERAHASLSRYFSPNLAERLASDGRRRTRRSAPRDRDAFHRYCEFHRAGRDARADVLGPLLNEYLSGMTDIVFAHEAQSPRSSATLCTCCSAPRASSRTMPRARWLAHWIWTNTRNHSANAGTKKARARRHPDRRSCWIGDCRQFRRRSLLRLHRLWRHHQCRGAARSRQQAARHPHLRQCDARRQSRRTSAAGRSAT